MKKVPPCLSESKNAENSVGARDFSPGYMHRDFGTKVPCPDNAKFQFISRGELASQELIMLEYFTGLC